MSKVSLITIALGLAMFTSSHVYSQVTGASPYSPYGTTTQGFDPTQMIMSPRAFQLANNPFGELQFEACEQKAMTTVAIGADLKTAAAQSLGSALGTAMAPGSSPANTAQAMISGMGGQNCPGVVTPVTVGMTCNDFRLGSTFNQNACQAAILNVETQQSLATCKMNNANRAAAMTGCFSQEIDQLKSDLRDVKKDFDINTTAMNQYESSVKAADRLNDQTIDTLGGKIASIQKTKDSVQALITKINGGAQGSQDTATVGGLQKRLTAHVTTVNAFNLRKKKAVVQKDAACMQGSGASTSAIRNCPNGAGDLMTPLQCVLSIYRDTVALSLSGGSNRINPADQKKANFAEKQFAARVNQMMSDLSGDNPRTSTLSSWLARYQSELNRYGAAGQQIVSEMQACDGESQSDIQKELADPSIEGGLGQQAAALNQTAQTISSELGSMLGDLDGAIRDAGREVYGQELNQLVNGYGCNTAAVASNSVAGPDGSSSSGTVSFQPVDLQTQMKCVQGLNQNLLALMNGTPPPGSSVPIQVPLNVPGLNGSPARCQGLRDCLDVATKLVATAKQTKLNYEGAGTFTDPRCPSGCPGLMKFHHDANVQIRAALQQASDLFGNRVAMMKMEFNRVKDMMSQAGADFPSQKVNQQSLDDICKISEDAVCNLPGNFDDVLGGLAGVPPLSSDDFTVAQKAARAQATEVAQQSASFNNQLTKLHELLGACPRDDKSRAAQLQMGDLQEEITGALANCTFNASNNYPALGECGTRPSELQTSLSEICRSLQENATDPLQNSGCKRAKIQLENYRQACSHQCQKNASDAAGKPAVIPVAGAQAPAAGAPIN